MPIINTVEELAQFLEQNDEWRRRLFAILVPRSLQQMPDDLDEFRKEARAEFKAIRTEMREGFGRVDREFDNLRTEMNERFERVEAKVQQNTDDIAELKEISKKNTNDIADLKGLSLEQKYRDQARSWLSKHFKNVRLIDLPDLEDRMPEQLPLSESERDELAVADLLALGIRKTDGQECVLVVEVSWVVDSSDVERAVRRAQMVAARGLCAVALAAGRELAEGAREQAAQLGCGVLIGGRFELDPANLP